MVFLLEKSQEGTWQETGSMHVCHCMSGLSLSPFFIFLSVFLSFLSFFSSFFPFSSSPSPHFFLLSFHPSLPSFIPPPFLLFSLPLSLSSGNLTHGFAFVRQVMYCSTIAPAQMFTDFKFLGP
jgi:hypothetical protein